MMMMMMVICLTWPYISGCSYKLSLLTFIFSFRFGLSKFVLPLTQGRSLSLLSVLLRALSKLFAPIGNWEGTRDILGVPSFFEWRQLVSVVRTYPFLSGTKQEGQRTPLRSWSTWLQRLFWKRINTKNGWRGSISPPVKPDSVATFLGTDQHS